MGKKQFLNLLSSFAELLYSNFYISVLVFTAVFSFISFFMLWIYLKEIKKRATIYCQNKNLTQERTIKKVLKIHRFLELKYLIPFYSRYIYEGIRFQLQNPAKYTNLVRFFYVKLFLFIFLPFGLINKAIPWLFGGDYYKIDFHRFLHSVQMFVADFFIGYFGLIVLSIFIYAINTAPFIAILILATIALAYNVLPHGIIDQIKQVFDLHITPFHFDNISVLLSVSFLITILVMIITYIEGKEYEPIVEKHKKMDARIKMYNKIRKMFEKITFSTYNK